MLYDLFHYMNGGFNVMNEVSSKEKMWNCRLRGCIKAKHLTQKELAIEFNKKYKTSCTQRDISRWTNVGTKPQKGRKIGFPSYQNMLNLAEFFDVSVAFLTGETNNDAYDIEKASSFLNINQSSIKSIRKIARSRGSYAEAGKKNGQFNRVLNKLLCSDYFYCLIETLTEFNDAYFDPTSKKIARNNVVRGFGPTLPDGTSEHGNAKPNESNVSRYRLLQIFSDLIDHLYPNT